MKHLSVEAVGRLVEAAEGDRNKLLFRLLFEHGLRISECLKLTQGSMQRGGYLRVRASKKGKHTDEKMDPATVALWNRVTEHLCPGTMLFPFSRQWADTLFHRYCDKTGIELPPRCGVHSLRHGLGHAMLASGASLPEIQKALRHRSLTSTSVYLEADASDTDRARAKAIAGAVVHVHGTVAVPEPMSLAAIQAEMQRLTALALAMQAAAPDHGHPRHPGGEEKCRCSEDDMRDFASVP
jgi:integrase